MQIQSQIEHQYIELDLETLKSNIDVVDLRPNHTSDVNQDRIDSIIDAIDARDALNKTCELELEGLTSDAWIELLYSCFPKESPSQSSNVWIYLDDANQLLESFGEGVTQCPY